MLKKISKIISADLLKVIMEMGHGDEIVFAGANFPATSHGRQLVSYPGIQIVDLMPAVLELFPLDAYVDVSAMVIEVVKGDGGEPPVWQTYRDIISKEDEKCKLTAINRDEFYVRTKKAYAMVATGDTAMYSTIILRKGVC